MMHGHEKSDLVIVAMKPANKAKKAPCGGVCGGGRSGVGGAKGGAKGNTHQQSTYWTQSQGRVSKALERIRRLVPLPTRGRSRMRESRTYGSGRGACDETHVPTATATRVHRASLRRGRRVAARSERAAASDASSRNPRQRIAGSLRALYRSDQARPPRSRPCRGSQRRDRIPVGGRTIRSAAAASDRIGGSWRSSDHSGRGRSHYSSRQGRDSNDSDRVRHRGGPSQNWRGGGAQSSRR